MINDIEPGIELTVSIVDRGDEKRIRIGCKDQRTDVALAMEMPADRAIATGLAILEWAEKAEPGSVDRYLDALPSVKD
jgi:hypothetical protein